MDSIASYFFNGNEYAQYYVILLMMIIFVAYISILVIKDKIKEKIKDKQSKQEEHIFTIKDDKKLSRNDLFSNCLVNTEGGSPDYYRFSFTDINDIRLYIACIYDENNNRADVATTLESYSDFINYKENITDIKNKKAVSYITYTFNLDKCLKYIKEFSRELYETDLMLGLNNIIHGYSEDGYIDFYIVIGDEVFDKYIYNIFNNAIEKNFSDRRKEVMEGMLLDELECEDVVEDETDDYSYENEISNSSEYVSEEESVDNAFIEDLKNTTEQVKDLVDRVNEITGSNISIGRSEDLEVLEEEEVIEEESCDLLRYITYEDENGEEQEIQVKHLPKKFNDWEERFANELTKTEIDKINELYGKWYSKKNKGKEITLPDGRKANINTGETSSIGGGSGNVIAEAISALSESDNSGAGALLGALATMTSKGNISSNMNSNNEETKEPQFDVDKLQESVDNNTK